MRPYRLLTALLAAALLATGIAAAAIPAPAQAKKRNTDQIPAPASPFAWRGVIEGFYGTPWTHSERMRVIRWMGDHGFNAYIHAPKGDVFETSSWRSPYPPADQAKFGREIAAAAALGVQWIPNISPARGSVRARHRICFSCASDLDTLVAKFQPFLDAGARTVMVSFDDIAPQLGTTDAAAYGARFPGTPPDYQFARATAELLNSLLLRLPRHTTLLTVLPDYSGTVDSPFLQGIRDGALNPAIGVLWTGPRIRASQFTAADAAAYGALIGRQPIMWENWVARDFVPTRIFLGPFHSRTEVVGSVQGFFFNPMNEADLNLLPLATAGDWMKDPDTYSARRSWRAAVTELARGRQPQLAELRAFAETNYSSVLSPTEAPTSTRLQTAFLRAYGRGARWTDAADSLRGELALVQKARRGLRSLRNKHIAVQAQPFLTQAAGLATLGREGLDLLAAERPSLELHSSGGTIAGTALPPDPGVAADLRGRLAQGWASARTAPIYVYGCRVATRGCGSKPYNRMDDFLTKVTALDGEWAPQADAAGARRRLSLTAGGKRIRRHRDGTFELPKGSCGTRVLATDGAGGQTSLPLPRCPRKPKHRKSRHT